MRIYTHKNTARIADAAYKASAARMMDILATDVTENWKICPWDRWVPDYHKEDIFTPEIAAEVRDELGWKDCEFKSCTGRFAPLEIPDTYEFITRNYRLEFYYKPIRGLMRGWSCYLYSNKDKVSYVIAVNVPDEFQCQTTFDQHLTAFIHLTKALKVLK